MRELNGIPFATDEEIRQIARTSKEHDVTSHGGSVNKGDGINVDTIFAKYENNSLEKAASFEAFVSQLIA